MNEIMAAMKSSRTLLLILAVLLVPGGLLLLLPVLAKPVAGMLARVAALRARNVEPQR